MNEEKLELVTIVAEKLLRDEILDEIRRLGSKGHTITEVTGEGSRHLLASDWEGRNVKIATVVPTEVADRILSRIAERFFEHYSVIAYAHPVRVVRRDKYE